MVAQTVPSGGSLPVLHLLTSPDALTPYRIAVVGHHAAELHRAAVRPAPAGVAAASPTAPSLAVAPTALVTQYAGSLSFPARTVADPAFTADPFAGQVRQNASTQAASVAAQSGFTQRHDVVPGSTYAVQQAAGGALVFSVLKRTDTFTVRKGQSLTAPKAFTALVPGRTRITSRATMTTLEFVVFGVPASSGDATLVAASEQLVSAAGS